ncbi:TetR/AcrR family transcriptional regulator [Smaragdicoccus niigatensis]|uniref:TetR/AcrR family transcriptional regulator n=1 Tax=Smaragdicoccus niigatensis TaxID=359359 RepID=UPI000371F5DA|nr:TetR family transcriptional regulator [Smaragdicoccus niigatensis]
MVRQARSQARRDALLRATVEVAAEQGTAGITHRSVTEKAGLPLATVSYFFDSITDLAREAITHAVNEDAQQLTALAADLTELKSTPDEIASAFAASVAPRWPDTPALFEAYLAAARREDLRETIAESLETARSVAVAAASAAGAPAAKDLAPALVALAHGFALHGLAVPSQVETDDIRRAARTLFIGHLVENGLVDEAVALANAALG